MDPTPNSELPPDFDQVFKDELEAIGTRRENFGGSTHHDAVEEELVGLAISGGGIRVATFALGSDPGLGWLQAQDH